MAANDGEWRVIASDTFDRDSPATTDARGHGLLSGLRELWRRVLTESVHDSGSKTFTDFTLVAGDHIDLGMQPFDNHAYAKLRTWVYGKPGPFETGGAASRADLLARENTRILDALITTHARLLALEDRVKPGWQADSAAGQIRACVHACDDETILVERLATL